MSAHRRAPRPYRGGKRNVTRRPGPVVERPVPPPGAPGGPGHLDLAHDVSAELRDHDGKWTANPLGRITDAVMEPVDDIDWDGGDFSAEQEDAQYRAEQSWYYLTHQGFASNPGACVQSEEMNGTPQQGWGLYQVQAYKLINDKLRGTKISPTDEMTMRMQSGRTVDQMVGAATSMFDSDMAFKTEAPGVTWRGVSSDHHVKFSDFEVGKTWTDKGIISTAADPDEVAGFLEDQKTHNPYLLKIRVPAGTTIVGGYLGGVETMLRNGTQFRVVAKGKTKRIGGRSGVKKYTDLPTVTLEVIP